MASSRKSPHPSNSPKRSEKLNQILDMYEQIFRLEKRGLHEDGLVRVIARVSKVASSTVGRALQRRKMRADRDDGRMYPKDFNPKEDRKHKEGT